MYQVTFGKYAGYILEEIPSTYLYWLCRNDFDDEAATMADKEYDWRTLHEEHWDEDM